MIRILKHSLLFDSYSQVDKDTNIDEKEKREKLQTIHKFLDMIDNNTWFLFQYVNKSKDIINIMSKINSVLLSFSEKLKLLIIWL